MNVKVHKHYDDSVRPRITCRIINEEMHRPFLGFNRAQFSVIELAVLSTRLGRIDDKKVKLVMEGTSAPKIEINFRYKINEAKSSLYEITELEF